MPGFVFCQVCSELMEQKPAGYGGMKTYLKSTYDKVEKLKKADEEKLKADLESIVEDH